MPAEGELEITTVPAEAPLDKVEEPGVVTTEATFLLIGLVFVVKFGMYLNNFDNEPGMVIGEPS